MKQRLSSWSLDPGTGAREAFWAPAWKLSGEKAKELSCFCFLFFFFLPFLTSALLQNFLLLGFYGGFIV